MFRYVVAVSLVVAVVSAVPYEKAAAPILMSSGYGGGAAYGGHSIVHAAIQTKHHIKHYDVPSTGHIQPTTIEVGANVIPLTILFRSASSALNIKQLHEGQRGSHQETQSEDEPHRLSHQVLKPVIQEVREVIMPMRRIIQEITPVQEEVNTLVARGHPGSSAAGPGPLAAGPGPLAAGPGPLAAGPGPLIDGPAILEAAAPVLLEDGPGPLALEAGLFGGKGGPGKSGLATAILDDLGYGMRPLKMAPAPLIKKYKKK